MMIVGIDSTPLSNPYSGGGRYALNILRYITAQDDIQVQFYGLKPAPTVMEEFPNIHFFERTGGNTRWYRSILPDLLEKTGCQSYWGFPLPLVKVPGIKYVTTILDVYALYLHRVERWSPSRTLLTTPQRYLSRWVIGRSLTVADRVLVISNATGRDLKKYFRKNDWVLAPPAPDIIPAAVSLELQTPDVPYVLAVGGYQPFRNRVRLIKAFSNHITKSKYEGDLVIAGSFRDNQERRKFEELRKNNGVERRVRFVTNSNDNDLANLYRHAKGFIHPTLCEGFGMPIVEALSFGKPVVVSTAGAVPEVSAGFELIQFDPFDVSQIEAALGRLFDCKAESPTIIESRQQYASSFAWHRSGQATLEAIR